MINTNGGNCGCRKLLRSSLHTSEIRSPHAGNALLKRTGDPVSKSVSEHSNSYELGQVDHALCGANSLRLLHDLRRPLHTRSTQQQIRR